MQIAVYCASSTKIHPDYFVAAAELGSLLAKRGIKLINGAGNMGLMAATSNAALAAGGEVTGVIPKFIPKNDPSNIAGILLIASRKAKNKGN